MTEKLARAFDRASKLPDTEQDRLAEAILEELESDQRWDGLFARSQDTLSDLASNAIAEHRAGRTEPMDGPA